MDSSTWSEDDLNFDRVLCGEASDPDDEDDEEVLTDHTTYSVYKRKYLLCWRGAERSSRTTSCWSPESPR